MLPGNEEILLRDDDRLTRPELSILLAYSKMQLYQALLESELALVETAQVYLTDYFPDRIQQLFAASIKNHPLGKEIAATMVTNHLVDCAGAAFADRLSRATGCNLPQVAIAYLFIDQLLDGGSLRREIYTLDNRLPAEHQHRHLLDIEDAIANMVLWGLNNGFDLDLEAQQIAGLQHDLQTFLSGTSEVQSAAMQEHQGAGFSESAAAMLAKLSLLNDFLPVVTLARLHQLEVTVVTVTYAELKQYLSIDSLLNGIGSVVVQDQWDRMAAGTLSGQFEALIFEVAGLLIEESGGHPPDVNGFFQQRHARVKVYRNLLKNLLHESLTDLHPFVVLLGSLRRLIV
jgi:glutamate dehydrogenase